MHGELVGAAQAVGERGLGDALGRGHLEHAPALVVELAVERSSQLGVDLQDPVDRVPDGTGEHAAVDAVEGAEHVRRWGARGDAHQVEVRRVLRLHLAGGGGRAATLGVPAHHGGGVGGEVGAGQPDRGACGVQGRAALGVTVDVGVVPGRAQPLVVGDDDGEALGEHRVRVDQRVPRRHRERGRLGAEPDLHGLGGRALVALALRAGCDHGERSRARAGPGGLGLQVGAGDGDGSARRARRAVHDPLCVGGQRSAGDEVRHARRDGHGLAADHCSGVRGQLRRWGVERGPVRRVGRTIRGRTLVG